MTIHSCCGCSCDVCKDGHSEERRHTGGCVERFYARVQEKKQQEKEEIIYETD